MEQKATLRDVRPGDRIEGYSDPMRVKRLGTYKDLFNHTRYYIEFNTGCQAFFETLDDPVIILKGGDPL